jgi:hypothetical protein
MRMIAAMSASLAAVGLAACGSATRHEYPESARTQFNTTCPAGDAVCDCTWDKLTRTVPYEDYEAALERFAKEGLMDPRVARARTECLERHAG